jgi:hypothetical protein
LKKEERMETLDRDEQLAIETYKLLNNLWMCENPVKTSKLQMLMATNSILVSAFFLAGQTVWIAVVGFLFSIVWTMSIGRTTSFQRHWQLQMDDIRKKYENNPIFEIHSVKIRPPIWGRLSSRYYLLGTPIFISLAWLLVVLYILIR